ncbi:MAG: hypothetical protein AB1467_04410 [Candidatus Diapherotrites archaeon]
MDKAKAEKLCKALECGIKMENEELALNKKFFINKKGLKTLNTIL